MGILGVHEVVGPYSLERPDVLSQVDQRIRQLAYALFVLGWWAETRAS